MDYRRISADCHLDLPWMPPELFVSEASAALRDRMPHVVDGPQGPYWTTNTGKNFGFVNGVGPTGFKYVAGENGQADKMAATALYSDGEKGIRRVSDPHLRIKDMDRDGVDAEVIYGILGAAARLNDLDVSNEMQRIYNNWLVDFQSHYPDRQLPLACIPSGDVNASAAEIRRVAKLGLRGVEVATVGDMMPLWHPYWEPMWQAINEVNLPVHFHTFPQMSKVAAIEGVSGDVRKAAVFCGITGFQLHLVDILAGMMGATVFERYPNLRVVFGESGAGWLPYVLDRMDYEFEFYFREIPLKMPPSEYWKRQCKATFQYDCVAAELLHRIGENTVMWGCDFPHADGTWPDSTGFIDRQFAGLAPDVVRKLTCENAGKLYGFMN